MIRHRRTSFEGSLPCLRAVKNRKSDPAEVHEMSRSEPAFLIESGPPNRRWSAYDPATPGAAAKFQRLCSLPPDRAGVPEAFAGEARPAERPRGGASAGLTETPSQSAEEEANDPLRPSGLRRTRSEKTAQERVPSGLRRERSERDTAASEETARENVAISVINTFRNISVVHASDAPPSDLRRLLAEALADVGVPGDACAREAAALATDLAALYVRTPDQLREALDAPHVLADVARCLRGRLLPAARARLAARAKLLDAELRAAWSKLREDGAPPPLPRGRANRSGLADRSPHRPLLRRLEVARVDVTHIAEIDQINQSFYARVFLVLRIAGGASDPDLNADFDGFPLDPDGRPTFRPSAKWYLHHLDFPNGKNLKITEAKVTKEGEDLLLIQQVEGLFFERFELQNFPFDEQDLTVTVSCNCELEGPVPVEFCLSASPPPQLGVDTLNFTHGDIWTLSPTMLATLTTVGASSTRRFPAVHLSANVRRHSGFVLMNAAMPVSIISFLSLMTFFVPDGAGHHATADGRGVQVHHLVVPAADLVPDAGGQVQHAGHARHRGRVPGAHRAGVPRRLGRDFRGGPGPAQQGLLRADSAELDRNADLVRLHGTTGEGSEVVQSRTVGEANGNEASGAEVSDVNKGVRFHASDHPRLTATQNRGVVPVSKDGVRYAS